MKKRAKAILNHELISILTAKSKEQLSGAMTKIATLADILDQSGDEKSANKVDDLLKQAGFWSSLLSGLSGGSGVALWDAFKSGSFKGKLTDIVKKALVGGATGVVVDYIIKGLDEVPLIGGLLKELEGADKLRMVLEGVIGGAVAESNFVETLVDKAIAAIEGVIGIGGGAKPVAQEAINPSPNTAAPASKVPGTLSTW